MVVEAATLGEMFARALLAKDWDGVVAVLHPDVDLKGLTPGRQWEASSATDAVDDVFSKWFEPGDDVREVLNVDSDRVVDRERVVYRARVDNAGGAFVCEQTAYFDTDGQRITRLRILCSGFIPVSGRARS